MKKQILIAIIVSVAVASALIGIIASKGIGSSQDDQAKLETVRDSNLPTASDMETDDVKEMVANAIKLYDKIGNKSFESFDSSPEFHQNDLYMFVFKDSDSVLVSHGANKAMIGKSVDSILDIYGNSIGKMIHDKVTEDGIWIEYLWQDPKDMKTRMKTSWVVKHEGYIFGSGRYDTTSTAQSDESQPRQIRTEPIEVIIPVGSPLEGCDVINTCYVPYESKIYSGETIVWKNIDSAQHTITSGSSGKPDGLYDSGIIKGSGSFQYTFSNSGKYQYFCSIHPWMNGIISVK